MIANLITQAQALYDDVDKYIAGQNMTASTKALHDARGAASVALGQLQAHAAVEAEAAEEAAAAAAAAPASPAAPGAAGAAAPKAQ
jgi:peptidoglycan hydrolase CwlO-like protein